MNNKWINSVRILELEFGINPYAINPNPYKNPYIIVYYCVRLNKFLYGYTYKYLYNYN